MAFPCSTTLYYCRGLQRESRVVANARGFFVSVKRKLTFETRAPPLRCVIARGDGNLECAFEQRNPKSDIISMTIRGRTHKDSHRSFHTNSNRRMSIPFVLQRGGTSKGVFFEKNDLPECPELRDIVIQDAFGSPDIRQIDGMGGADVLTSKVAIVSKRANTETIEADVDYLFGQVKFGGGPGRETPSERVLYDVNCGNISAGVGPFVIEEGLIEVNDDTVTSMDTGENHAKEFHQKVRIYNVNTRKVITAEVPVEKIALEKGDDGSDSHVWMVTEEGDYAIDGVPGTAASIRLDFANCVGTLGCNSGRVAATEGGDSQASIFPTGNIRDKVTVGNKCFDVSLVDVANFVVHIDGRQLGLKGTERSSEILKDTNLLDMVRKIRHEAAKLVLEESEITPTRPFTSVVFPFHSDSGYESIQGDMIHNDTDCDEASHGIQSTDGSRIDFRSFVLFCDHPHKAYPGTASNATAAAALIDGTVVNDNLNLPIASTNRYRKKIVTIGHPSGRIMVSSEVEEKRRSEVGTNREFVLHRSIIGRTSRRIADGRLYLKPDTARQWRHK